MQPEKVAFELKLGQSKPIYNALKEIREGSSWDTLTEAQQRIVEGSFTLKFQDVNFKFVKVDAF
jgi:oligopeptidase A